MKSLRSLLVIALVLVTGLSALAQDKEQASGMPEMGPPKEIKDMKWVVGNWDVAMKSKWNPADTAWIDEKATAKFSYVAGGSAISMNFEGSMSGMPFSGFMLQTYDSQAKEWQSVWVDNFSARISYSAGKKENGKTVMLGDDVVEGQKIKMRMTTFNETPTRFEWSMESSMDGGKTFMTMATAVYTKQK